MSDNKQDKQTEPPPPLRRMLTVVDGASGQVTRHVAQGKELQTKPEPQPGVKALTDPTVWPGPPENWW